MDAGVKKNTAVLVEIVQKEKDVVDSVDGCR